MSRDTRSIHLIHPPPTHTHTHTPSMAHLACTHTPSMAHVVKIKSPAASRAARPPRAPHGTRRDTWCSQAVCTCSQIPNMCGVAWHVMHVTGVLLKQRCGSDASEERAAYRSRHWHVLGNAELRLCPEAVRVCTQ